MAQCTCLNFKIWLFNTWTGKLRLHSHWSGCTSTQRVERIVTPSIIVFGLITFFLGTSIAARADLYGSVKRHQDSDVDPRFISRLNPYNNLITYFAGRVYLTPHRPIHPHFIRALILAESSGKVDAISEKGAIGLGQILFTTGKEAAARLARSQATFKYVQRERLMTLSPNDLKDPGINILLTCYLLATYNQRFNGRLDLIVSAWNAGVNQKSLQQNRHVPFQETENLIGRINGYYLYLLQHYPQ